MLQLSIVLCLNFLTKKQLTSQRPWESTETVSGWVLVLEWDTPKNTHDSDYRYKPASDGSK